MVASPFGGSRMGAAKSKKIDLNQSLQKITHMKKRGLCYGGPALCGMGWGPEAPELSLLLLITLQPTKSNTNTIWMHVGSAAVFYKAGNLVLTK
jgi:hypothetical protein